MPNDTARTFHVLDVVTVATGILVAPDGIGAVYKLCGHMLGDPGVMTHQLPAASRACEASLTQQFPWLADLPVPDGLQDAAIREPWCEHIMASFGESVRVEPVAEPQWHSGRALQDLVEMVGPERVVPVVEPHRGQCPRCVAALAAACPPPPTTTKEA